MAACLAMDGSALHRLQMQCAAVNWIASRVRRWDCLIPRLEKAVLELQNHAGARERPKAEMEQRVVEDWGTKILEGPLLEATDKMKKVEDMGEKNAIVSEIITSWDDDDNDDDRDKYCGEERAQVDFEKLQQYLQDAQTQIHMELYAADSKGRQLDETRKDLVMSDSSEDFPEELFETSVPELEGYLMQEDAFWAEFMSGSSRQWPFLTPRDEAACECCSRSHWRAVEWRRGDRSDRRRFRLCEF
mmetsp:Transcript_13185/g.17841  ORF Transcript_13185/g.17841 Transcript_13185/m.17841 type:complete len:245 (+) Transcript_13185:45-779(+)